MGKTDKKTLEALKMAKQAVDLANNALESAIRELDGEELNKISGAGEFNDVPGVNIHRYKKKDDNRY